MACPTGTLFYISYNFLFPQTAQKLPVLTLPQVHFQVLPDGCAPNADDTGREACAGWNCGAGCEGDAV